MTEFTPVKDALKILCEKEVTAGRVVASIPTMQAIQDKYPSMRKIAQRGAAGDVDSLSLLQEESLVQVLLATFAGIHYLPDVTSKASAVKRH